MATTKNPLASFDDTVSFETFGISKVEEVLATHDKVEEILANLSKVEERTGEPGPMLIIKTPLVPGSHDLRAFEPVLEPHPGLFDGDVLFP